MLRFKAAAMVAALSMIALTSCRAPEEMPAQEGIPTAPSELRTAVHEKWATQTAMAFTPTAIPPTLTPVPALPPSSSPEASGASTSYGAPIELPGSGRYLTEGELDEAGATAGWEAGPWTQMRNIVYCETGGTLYTHAHNASDANGGSHGLAQINGSYAFHQAGEDFGQRYDPIVNLRVAKWLWEARGRVFGGTGGWYWCSLKFGYD